MLRRDVLRKSDFLRAMSALAQETRLDIIRLLVQEGPSGLPAGEIGRRLELQPPTLSFHLSQLKNAGLVKCQRESRLLRYSAAFPVVNGLVAYLTDNCCGGRDELCLPVSAAPLVESAEGRKI